MPVTRVALAILAGSVFATAGCRPEIIPEAYVPTDAHDAYRHSLEVSGLLDTALGRDWQDAAEAAMRTSIEIQVPFQESVYIDPTRAFATSYRFSVLRGQRMEVKLSVQPAADWRLYLDLFRMAEEPGQPPVHVASGGEGDLRLAFEPRSGGHYLVRVQSELLRGGSCTIQIRTVPALEFPVSGHDTGSIGSSFGAPREAGRRQHHGVDIFAPRHTDVLATSRARVRRVDDWRLGGHIIWLEDPERNLRLYFAHLETQDVLEGVWVERGDRIGTVGNSGNARTTPPHLHFGIYARGEGPIDPYPFLHRPEKRPRDVKVNLEALGQWVRTKRDGVYLAAKPDDSGTLQGMPAHTPLRVWGGADRSYRVALPNGVVGYVREDATERLNDPLDSLRLSHQTIVHDRPAAGAAVVRRLERGTEVDVLARYESYVLVDSEWERPEWIDVPAGSQPSAAAATAP